MGYYTEFRKVISDEVGLSSDEIKGKSPRSIISHIVARNKKGFSFSSEWPCIGRGSVLRDFETKASLDKSVDEFIVS